MNFSLAERGTCGSLSDFADSGFRASGSARRANSSHKSLDRGFSPSGQGRAASASLTARPSGIEDQMSSQTAEQAKIEASSMRTFIATILLALVVTVAAGFFYGLAGIGAVAIVATALMLVVVLLLTKG
jgi:Flp pilus assembly protein TadB